MWGEGRQGGQEGPRLPLTHGHHWGELEDLGWGEKVCWVPSGVSDPFRGASFSQSTAARDAGSPQGFLFPSEELSHLRGTGPTQGTGGRGAGSLQGCPMPSEVPVLLKAQAVPDSLRDAASPCDTGWPVPFGGA